VSDDLEQDLARLLRDRVADMPASHDVAPATLARVHRRRSEARRAHDCRS
jgi:hypothetical protein